MMMLTPHFSLDKLTKSDTALRLGIDNKPTALALANLGKLAFGLETVRAVLGFPLNINDAYRCEELEKVMARTTTLAPQFVAASFFMLGIASWIALFKV